MDRSSIKASRDGVVPNCRAAKMPEKTYIVRFKRPALGIQEVIASTAEIHDEHLVFCDSKGKLTALFLVEIVQSWNCIS
jgi:hypothetical protein